MDAKGTFTINSEIIAIQQGSGKYTQSPEQEPRAGILRCSAVRVHQLPCSTYLFGENLKI